MKMTTQTEFGRQDSCVQIPNGPDKWALLKDLSEGADSFGLSHRSLGVLKALLTFLPDRALPLQPNAAIVFPSNRTLSDRLNGMPESTLRRHLGHLVAAGVITRHASPNGKRYARQVRGHVDIAFGFDLSPLAWRADEVADAALLARETRERCKSLRDRLMALRHTLLSHAIEPDQDLNKLLRRKLSPEQLEALIETLVAQLPDVENPVEPVVDTAKMNTAANQNERHIQDTIKSDFDSEGDRSLEMSPEEIMEQCKETQALFPDRVRTWQDLHTIANQLAPMLGINQPVWHEALQRLGQVPAAIAVLSIHERLSTIRSPGAYLRCLGQKAAMGRFSVLPMLKALQHTKAQNCQLTI
ncbi:MAG: plasmid replication protein RepC [Pelagimonas sp.]|uniref:plasmid replication protein RepC n=1 Tax=Pelagimonas sp. TaxID=2073170 RepID=UPI003D6A8503